MAASLPKLEIYRTDSYKSETTTTTEPWCALENFCPVKIFSPVRRGGAEAKRIRDERDRGREDGKGREKKGEKEKEKSTSPTEQDRDVDAAVKTSKSRRAESLPVRRKRTADMAGSYDWGTQLAEPGFCAAPVSCFKHVSFYKKQNSVLYHVRVFYYLFT